MEDQTKPSLIHSLEKSDKKISQTGLPIFLFIFVFIAATFFGVITGFFLKNLSKKPISSTKISGQAKTVGIKDKKTFKDKAEGVLKEGGINGEGNFHLERTGGQSQNVYLTSTAVDLSQFVNKKVRVWGVTFEGEKAGWLMDVGLVEMLQ